MKKFTPLLFALLALTVTKATAGDNLTFNWAHCVDGATSAGDNVLGITKSTDSHYYVATTFCTTSSALNVNFDGGAITDANGNAIEGSPYTGSSNNGNLLLQKIDPSTGAVVWFAYTDKGDVEQGCTKLASTSDGGVLVSAKVRAWVEEAGLDNLLEIVDATGSKTTIKDMWTQSGEYRQLIFKISSEGKLEWTRLISGLCLNKGEMLKDTEKTALTQATKNNFYVYGMALDDANNIYLCGNYRTKLYFKKSDGTLVTLTAQNNTGWSGDPQKVLGDLFLVKLDSNGYYTNSLTAEGTASCAFFDNIVYADGKLYLNGRIQADSTIMTIGGKEVAASMAYQTMILASVNTEDLTVNYLNALPTLANSASKFALQNKSAQLIGDYTYYTGLINGSWAKPESSDTLISNNASKQLKGYVLKVNNATGEAEKAYVRTAGSIGGYFGVYVAPTSTYAFGYDMSGGAMLTRLENDTYKEVKTDTICTFGTVSSCATPLVDGDNFVMMNRGKSTATFFGSETSFSSTNWGTVYYSYKIDDTVTGINAVKASSTADYNVYTLDGIRVKTASSYDEATKNLRTGTYVIGGKKVAVE